MSFPAYEEYKDSGVEWLEKVPEHWVVDRFKRSTVSCRNGIWGSEAQGDENDIKCVRVADFDRESLTTCDDIPTTRNVTESERAERTLSQGNLLLEKSGGGALQPVGFVVLYDSFEPAVCSNFVAKVELADGMNPSYWRYCHAAAYSIRLNYRSIKQTTGIQNLDQSQYLDERAPFPPLPEQTAIASFLDSETSKIDSLVDEQRRLIELLKEKRQAVISHAVTKGLDPNAPMKESSIEWLGEVPEGWTVTKLGFLSSKIGSGKTPRGGSETYVDEGVLFVRSQNVYDEGLRLEDVVFISNEVDEEMAISRVENGDILLNITGASLGRTCLVPEDSPSSNVNQHVCIIRLEDPEQREFVAMVMKASVTKSQIDAAQNGAAREGLNFERIRQLRLAVPPRVEQQAIVSLIDSETSKIDAMATLAERAIELLQERRTALISAAVTGKIDVRNHSSALSMN